MVTIPTPDSQIYVYSIALSLFVLTSAYILTGIDCFWDVGCNWGYSYNNIMETADFILMLSYFIAVLIVCYISTVEYLLHMQCCNVTKMQHLTAAK